MTRSRILAGFLLAALLFTHPAYAAPVVLPITVIDLRQAVAKISGSADTLQGRWEAQRNPPPSELPPPSA